MSDIEPIELVLAVLLVLNCCVTFHLLFDRYLSGTQKLLQLLIVWFVPGVGAVGIYLMRRSDRDPRGPGEPPFGGGANDGMPGGIQGP